MTFILGYRNLSCPIHIGGWCMRRFTVIFCLSCCSVLIAGREERRQPLPLPKGHDGAKESEDHESGGPTQTMPLSSPNITTVVLVTTSTTVRTQTISPSLLPTGLSFKFNDPPNTTVCDSLLLSWLYSSQEVVDITIIVQSYAGNSTISPLTSNATFNASLPPPPSESITVTTDALSTTDNFKWSPVNVDVGWYFAKAFDTGAMLNISTISTPFHVDANEDTSCLNRSNATTSGMTPPTRTNASKSTLPAGDIAAIAIGGTAGALLLLVASIFPRWRRRKLSQQKEGRPRLLY